jgi:hypothetical protein
MLLVDKNNSKSREQCGGCHSQNTNKSESSQNMQPGIYWTSILVGKNESYISKLILSML